MKFDATGKFIRSIADDLFLVAHSLRVDSDGKVVGSFTGPQPGEGPRFDPHEIALGLDGSIFTAEVLGWRAEKLRPK